MATPKQRMAVFAIAQATNKLLTKEEYLNKYLTKFLTLVKKYSDEHPGDIYWFDPGFLVCTQTDYENALEKLEYAKDCYWTAKLEADDWEWK